MVLVLMATIFHGHRQVCESILFQCRMQIARACHCFSSSFSVYNVVRNSAFHYKHEIQNKTDNLPKCFGGGVFFFFFFPQKKSHTHTHTTLRTTDYKYEA